MNAHRTDGVSLGFGAVFLFFTGWWVLAQFVTLALPAVGWMVAIALIIFGMAGLVGAFRSGRGAVPAPTSGAPVSAAPPAGIPTGMHADIVRELMESQRTSGRDTAVGIDDTRVDLRPASAAAEPVQASPYATDYLTVPDPAPAGEPRPDDGGAFRPADDTEFRPAGDGEPRPADDGEPRLVDGDEPRPAGGEPRPAGGEPRPAGGEPRPAGGGEARSAGDGEARSADGDRTEVIEAKTEVIDEPPTTEIRVEGDGGRR
ncbi:MULTISPECIES: hypothetical protein [Catenuloplanes]|uniref:Uncharacterized protein n=1 Tax=Catenuloplanes niger TaxID=587534 RepID=A0AAE3ZPX5_9ACTN|nr:hypothetical protein [Catenuloplanes niger]MDR7322794.1 hypothetical protein [Catenuloplanes niger]